MERVLFVTSEYYPLIKTGGLADATAGLTQALLKLGHDVKVLMPAYPQALENLVGNRIIAKITVDIGVVKTIDLIEGHVADTGQVVWLVDCPEYFNRPGGPYLNLAKNDWSDNCQRFALLCRVAEDLALGNTLTQWTPTVVHCNDWHSGLIPALLSLHPNRPATVATIHNLAYQGVFNYEVFKLLKLPDEWWSFDKLEFYGNFSFLKASIVFADFITTVSPTYAQEIMTPEYGYGLDSVLDYYTHRVKGILNGVDYDLWNPESDHYIKYPYGLESISEKEKNKALFKSEKGLKSTNAAPLVGVVSRLVDQKGMDLLPTIIEQTLIPPLSKHNIQWAILGSGEATIESDLQYLARKYPNNVSVQVGYDESLAHNIEAAADFFLMPSRYEPCGLNQIYSLKYGTLPIVRKTGGLADTVVDANADNIKAGKATGLVFEHCDSKSILLSLKRALVIYDDKALLFTLRCEAMKQAFDWETSAREYEYIYQDVCKNLGKDNV